MEEMWNKRYANKAYAYGTDPNKFFKDSIQRFALSGDLLLPAEGEGRNAAYAAMHGFNVTAFDISIEGKKKALALANKHKVSIQYEVGLLPELNLNNKQFDAAALIFAHFPVPILSDYHNRIANLIKPEGYIILEGFSKSHLTLREANPAVGGPNNLEMLFSKVGIEKDFPRFEVLELTETEVTLDEGEFHQGTGSVIRFIGMKR